MANAVEESERSPLLCRDSSDDDSGPSRGKQPALTAIETTPLLNSSGSGASAYDGGDDDDGSYDDNGYDDHDNHDNEAAISSSPSTSRASAAAQKANRRWPSVVAMLLLALTSISIIVVAYFVPAAVEEYAKQGAVIEPTDLSLESITANGVRARIQANFRLDGSRVKNDQVRRIGQATTWIVRKLGTEKTTVDVFLPDYDFVHLGSAEIPPLTVDLVDGHTTAIDIVADLTPGDAQGIRKILNQWLEGRLDQVRLLGKADIALKTGSFPLGTHSIAESLVFEAKNVPSVPEYDIERIVFKDVDVPETRTKLMGVDVRITAFNAFPVQVDIPNLGFEVLMPSCQAGDPYIVVADVVTAPIAVRPHSTVAVEADGTVREISKSLTNACPGSGSSPLDRFLKQYMSGENAVVFVRGRKNTDGAPRWIVDFLSSVTVPVPFPGRSFDNLIREFSLTDVHFTLPDPLAEPGDPDANPTVSGTILVTAGLPDQMNFAINVTSVRATADVLYHKKKLGELDLYKWQDANSTMTRATKDQEATLKIQSLIKNAPLNVTDSDVLTDVIQKLIFGGEQVNLAIKALVDIRVETILGRLELKDVPAEGKIPVKRSLEGLAPRAGSIQILDSTPTSISLRALVNLTNPTEYSAHIPLINIHILHNDTIIGTAKAEDLDIVSGDNVNVVVGATWSPAMSGEHGRRLGRELLSQFVSGANTSLTLRAFHDSIPNQPIISDALSRFNFTVPAPHLALPGGGDGDGDDGDGDGGSNGGEGDKTRKQPGFIRDATFHFFSSRASFVLASPLVANTLYIEAIDAIAYYNHTEPVGTITSSVAFAVPPGLSQTPKLPVVWSLDSVGFEKLRKALGGDLKLDAVADVDVRLGEWRETIHYEGVGIGAHIRP